MQTIYHDISASDFRIFECGQGWFRIYYISPKTFSVWSNLSLDHRFCNQLERGGRFTRKALINMKRLIKRQGLKQPLPF